MSGQIICQITRILSISISNWGGLFGELTSKVIREGEGLDSSPVDHGRLQPWISSSMTTMTSDHWTRNFSLDSDYLLVLAYLWGIDRQQFQGPGRSTSRYLPGRNLERPSSNNSSWSPLLVFRSILDRIVAWIAAWRWEAMLQKD